MTMTRFHSDAQLRITPIIHEDNPYKILIGIMMESKKFKGPLRAIFTIDEVFAASSALVHFVRLVQHQSAEFNDEEKEFIMKNVASCLCKFIKAMPADMKTYTVKKLLEVGVDLNKQNPNLEKGMH